MYVTYIITVHLFVLVGISCVHIVLLQNILINMLIIKINSSILIYIYVNKFILIAKYKYILFPSSDFTTALFVIDNLNADSSGTTKCKAVGKVEGPPLRTMERSQPIIN